MPVTILPSPIGDLSESIARGLQIGQSGRRFDILEEQLAQQKANNINKNLLAQFPQIQAAQKALQIGQPGVPPPPPGAVERFGVSPELAPFANLPQAQLGQIVGIRAKTPAPQAPTEVERSNAVVKLLGRLDITTDSGQRKFVVNQIGKTLGVPLTDEFKNSLINIPQAGGALGRLSDMLDLNENDAKLIASVPELSKIFLPLLLKQRAVDIFTETLQEQPNNKKNPQAAALAAISKTGVNPTFFKDFIAGSPNTVDKLITAAALEQAGGDLKEAAKKAAELKRRFNISEDQEQLLNKMLQQGGLQQALGTGQPQAGVVPSAQPTPQVAGGAPPVSQIGLPQNIQPEPTLKTASGIPFITTGGFSQRRGLSLSMQPDPIALSERKDDLKTEEEARRRQIERTEREQLHISLGNPLDSFAVRQNIGFNTPIPPVPASLQKDVDGFKFLHGESLKMIDLFQSEFAGVGGTIKNIRASRFGSLLAALPEGDVRKFIDFRSLAGLAVAELRNKIFGAALTDVEKKDAFEFLPTGEALRKLDPKGAAQLVLRFNQGMASKLNIGLEVLKQSHGRNTTPVPDIFLTLSTRPVADIAKLKQHGLLSDEQMAKIIKLKNAQIQGTQ